MSSSSTKQQKPLAKLEVPPADNNEFVGMKFLGIDYFRVIYVSVTVLILLMITVYFTA
jgi:hypothetical protein